MSKGKFRYPNLRWNHYFMAYHEFLKMQGVNQVIEERRIKIEIIKENELIKQIDTEYRIKKLISIDNLLK